MSKIKHTDNNAPAWIRGELKLAGLDSRMIGLLRAIDRSGSINQAAKQSGLSYKGAWQIIERANNGAPKALVNTSTGGNKGGGTCLTEAGSALLKLFTQLEQKHSHFLNQLNLDISNAPDTILLLQRLVVKTSARNQLFGCIESIQTDYMNAEIIVKLKSGEPIFVNISLASLAGLDLKIGAEAVLLINNQDITLALAQEGDKFSTSNRLSGTVIRIQQDEINSEVVVLLPGGETLAVMITQNSAQNMALQPGQSVVALFKSNAPVLGVMPLTNDHPKNSNQPQIFTDKHR